MLVPIEIKTVQFRFKVSVLRQSKNSSTKDDMLHPDKTNGQEAQVHTRIPVVLRTLLWGLLLGLAGLSAPLPVKAAVLKEVRMGNHGDFIRVVFEFSAQVQYELSEKTDAGSVSIQFLHTTSELKGTPVSDKLDCIDTVSALQDGSHIVTNISFDRKKVKLNPFTIQNPDRVVLDVFCDVEPVAAIVLPEPQKISPAPVTLAEPSQKKPVATRPLVVKQAQVSKVLPKKKDTSQQYLLLLLAAITSIIVLLIGLIIFQKRSLSTGHQAGNADATIDTDDMMHAIDTKIKEKLLKYDE
jgi:hypothetical protein